MAKNLPSQKEGPGSIPGQGTRSHMLQHRVCSPQLYIWLTSTKVAWHSQMNKHIKKIKTKEKKGMVVMKIYILAFPIDEELHKTVFLLSGI